MAFAGGGFTPIDMVRDEVAAVLSCEFGTLTLNDGRAVRVDVDHRPDGLQWFEFGMGTAQLVTHFAGPVFDQRVVRISGNETGARYYFNVRGDGERIAWVYLRTEKGEATMIEHPDDYDGPSEPCDDLSGAPFGGGVPGRKCRVCPTAPVCLLSHACERLPDWEQAPLGPTVGGRPPGGWSDCGPDKEGE